MTDQPQDRYIEVDGLRLHYVEWGDAQARTVVLLHGLQDCARSWDFFAAAMSPEYRVLALDHRGHGDSDWAGAGRYRLLDYVADIEGLVGQLGLGRILLIGHSAGGRNALTYAVSHPEVVEALVVVDLDLAAANPDPGSEEAMSRQYKGGSEEWDSLEAVAEHLRTRQPDSAEEVLVHQALHMTRETPGGSRVWKRDRRVLEAHEWPDLWAEWSKIGCPALIVRGRQSGLLTHEVAVKMREAVSRVRLAELEGGGHWFYQEFPGAFETTVRWFLEDPPS